MIADKPLPMPPRQSTVATALALWAEHRAVGLMLFAQLLSSLMAASAKLLQTTAPEGEVSLSASEILFCMMATMAVLSWAYMAVRQTPAAPLGPRPVRALLAVRGVAGFFGIWGYYYSLRFLPIAEATVINFLAPMLAALASAALLHTPFTRLQRVAGLLSMLGVVLVAKPWHIVWPHAAVCVAAPGAGALNATAVLANCTIEGVPVASLPSPVEHALAVGVSLVGVAGGAASFVAIATIGQQAHPMITVSYFASCVTVLTAVSLALLPADALRLPQGREWPLLAFQGLCGFAMHVTITASLAIENTSRALNMVYSQIVFALIVDHFVWGTHPGPVSISGGVLILGSVIAVAVIKEAAKLPAEPDQEEARWVGEDVELMAADHLDDDDDDDEEGAVLVQQPHHT